MPLPSLPLWSRHVKSPLNAIVCAAAVRQERQEPFLKYEKLWTRWRNNGPPEFACRGRLQTALVRPWLKTVVVSVEGKGKSTRLVRCGSGRRVQANHRSGVENNPTTSKPGDTTAPGMSPSDTLLTGWAVSGVKVARAWSGRVRGTAGTRDP